MFTDEDEAATAAVAQVFPRSLHKYCIFHIAQSIRTHLGGLLGADVLSKALRVFETAASALTEDVSPGPKFSQVYTGIDSIPRWVHVGYASKIVTGWVGRSAHIVNATCHLMLVYFMNRLEQQLTVGSLTISLVCMLSNAFVSWTGSNNNSLFKTLLSTDILCLLMSFHCVDRLQYHLTT